MKKTQYLPLQKNHNTKNRKHTKTIWKKHQKSKKKNKGYISHKKCHFSTQDNLLL